MSAAAQSPHRKVLVTEPPTRPGDHRHWGELRGSSRSLAIVDAAERFDGLTLIITSSTDEALAIEQELHFFQSDREGHELLSLPDWETLPYDMFSP